MSEKWIAACLGLTFLAATVQVAFPLRHRAAWDITQPRGETRAIDFDTSEGTRMSVDLSPTGESLIFDLLGHVYRVPISGGVAKCLTADSGLAINFQPRYSPDGKKIAFVSDRSGQFNVWTMNADGAAPRLVATELDHRLDEPEWSPDGKYIFVRRQDMTGGRRFRLSTKLWKYDVATGEGEEVIGGATRGAGFPSVSADGTYLYFHVFNGDVRRADVVQGDYQIRRLVLSTGTLEQVTAGKGDPGAGYLRASNGGAVAPQISPDGRWLAFARRIPDGKLSYKGHQYGPRSALWLRDLDTGHERVLMDPIDVDQAGWDIWYAVSLLPRYRWAPDGKSIVLSQGGKLRTVRVDTGEVRTIPFTLRVQRVLSETAYSPFRIPDDQFRARYLRWPAGSPDGRQVVFQSVGRLWIAEASGGKPRRLTSDSFTAFEFMPAWSPDGQWIAFTSWDEKERGHLWVIPAAGGRPKQLTEDPGEYFHPAWSNDGAEVVVLRGSGATARRRPMAANVWYELVRVRVSGGGTTFIARISPPVFEGVRPPGGGAVRAPIVRASYGPGDRIFYPLQKGKRLGTFTELLSVGRDGGEPTTHLTFRDAEQVAVSPDGNWVAFQYGSNVYLTPMETGSEVIDRETPAVIRLSRDGGLFPRWRSNTVVEFGHGRRYFSHDTISRRTKRITIELEVQPRAPTGTIALRDARIITLNERKVIDKGTLIVREKRIVCVGDCDATTADRVIDARGKTIIPGLVDAHAHHHSQHLGIIPAHNFETAVYLAYGVTTTRNPAAPDEEVFPTAELTAAGLAIGPRTFSTGEGVGRGDGPGPNPITSAEVAMDEVQRRAQAGATAIKQYLQPRRDQRQWIVDAARKIGLTVTGEGGDLEFNLSMIMDGHKGFEHGLSHFPIYGDVAKFLGQADVVYSPVFSVAGPAYIFNQDYFFQEGDLWKEEKLRRFSPWWQLMPHLRQRMLRPATDYDFSLRAQGLADVIAEGGHGAIGSHGQQHGLSSHWEVWMAASALGPMGALEVASLHGAYFIGVDQDIGSIEPGKLADVVVLNSNPLDNIRNTVDIAYVMKAGILYDADTLDEIWPEDRPFGDYYWVNPDSLKDDVLPVTLWDKR